MEKAKSFITDISQKSPKFFQILLLFLITEAGIFVSFFIFKSSFNLEMLSDWFYVLEDLSYFLVLIFYILAYFKGVLNVWKGINWEHTFFEGTMLVMLGFAFILLAMSLVLTPLDIGSASLQNSLVLSIGLFGGYAFFLNLCFDEKEEKRRVVKNHITLIMGLILFLLVSYYPLGIEISENDLSFEEMFSLSLMFFVTLIFLTLLLLFREVIWGSSEKKTEIDQ